MVDNIASRKLFNSPEHSQTTKKHMGKYHREHTNPKSIRTKGKNDSICILHHLLCVSSQPSKLLHPIFYNLTFKQKNTSSQHAMLKTTSSQQKSRVIEHQQSSKLARPTWQLNHRNCEPPSFSVQYFNNTEQAIHWEKIDQTGGFLRKPSKQIPK